MLPMCIASRRLRANGYLARVHSLNFWDNSKTRHGVSHAWDIGNLIIDPVTYLTEFATVASAPTSHYSALSTNSITGTSAFVARSVLQGQGYTVSSELESLMYVTVFLALSDVVRWAKSPTSPSALAFKTESFCDQEKFERYVHRRCRKDLVVVVQKLRDLETNLPAQCHSPAIPASSALTISCR